MNTLNLSGLRVGLLKGAAAVAAVFLSACIFGGGGTEAGGTDADDAQVHYVQGLELDGEVLRAQPSLCDAFSNDVEHRRSGDTVEIEWGALVGESEMPLVDIYRRKADGAFPEGTLTRIGARVRASSTLLEQYADEIDSVLALENFVYEGEVVRVKNGVAGFAYPRLFLYPLLQADHENPEIVFNYVGKDSLVMTQGAETVTVKLKPFERFDVRSSDLEHEAIHADLDSCVSPDGWIYASEWLPEFLGMEVDLEKSASFPARRAGRRGR